VRYHRRQKRTVEQEIRFERPPTESGAFDVVDPHTDRPQAEDLADRLAEVLGALSPEEREVVDLKLQDLTNEEIALQLNSSERTVRRILKRVSTRLAAEGGG
jgi:RNA polymerase sigma factor (sigma-70 family)